MACINVVFKVPIGKEMLRFANNINKNIFTNKGVSMLFKEVVAY